MFFIDEVERALQDSIFEFVDLMISLKLSESELALMSALILIRTGVLIFSFFFFLQFGLSIFFLLYFSDFHKFLY